MAAEEVATGEVVEQSNVLSEGEVTSIVGGAAPEEAILPSDTPEFEMPDKFQGKSLEEVIKSYQELEKFKGKAPEEGGGQESTEGEVPLEPEKGKEEPTKVEQEQYDRYAESLDKNGSLSDVEYAELAKAGYDKATVDAEITNRKALQEFQSYKQEKALNDVLEPLGGGTDKFKEVADWANQSKTPEDIKAFNETLAKVPKIAQQAMQKGLYEEYASAGTSTDQVLHTGANQTTPSKGYTNETEMFKDMNNPAYNTDPKFNKAVLDKLSRTNREGWSF